MPLHASFHVAAAEILTAATRGLRSDAEHLMADDDGDAGTALRLTDELLAWINSLEAARR